MKMLKKWTGNFIFITIMAFCFFLYAQFEITFNHFQTVSNDIAEQNAQTITTNIEQGNSYYLNTVGYIVEDKSPNFVLNESTNDGFKSVPISLTGDQVNIIENKNNDKTYKIGVLAKIVDDNNNVEVVSATTDKDIVDRFKTERVVFIIITAISFVLSIACIATGDEE